ncbi:MAG: thioredoxin family protein [Ferruginibacter sp.]|nr:thioredoxin family protein [Ferruginibacter sp.]
MNIRLFFSLLFLAFLQPALAQDPMLTWSASAEALNEKQWKITLGTTIPEGWHMYLADDEEGLQGVKLTPPDASVSLQPLEWITQPIEKKDAIFEKDMKLFTGEIRASVIMHINGEVPPTLQMLLQYEIADKEYFLPKEQKIQLVLKEGAADTEQKAQRLLIPSIQLDAPRQHCDAASAASAPDSNSGLGHIFLLGFIGGLVALLTPCVFPMIPLTVSFFTKQSQNRRKGVFNAGMYGFFILLIYILLSLPFHFLDSLNPEILNSISTNVYLNVFFFLVFVFFALSFFGLFEITLPSSISNKADSKSGAGNLAGIFFMALTLALVSFSCTGPILGSLLAGSLSTNGGAMQLTSGMAGFGLALALPFAVFALFPNWLNSLPKSGGWLTTVKIVLGFLELGLAFKFLSNADLVMHWGLLKREIFIGIWVVIGICLSLYLFGILKFKHEYLKKPLSRLRVSFGVITALFTLYLIPGLTNTPYANLSLISGFPPPLYYSIYQKDNNCIYGLDCTDDYEEGIRKAKATGKAVLLDFTGYACVNCRRMEENVWTRPEVLSLMKEKFVVVSLYVDDKKKLPLAEQFTYTTREGMEREIKTVGDKWAVFETENFRNNAQPLYAILNSDEELMNEPVGYTPDVAAYLNWLRCGLEAAEKK